MNVLGILVVLAALHYGQSVAMKVLPLIPEAGGAATPNAGGPTVLNHGIYDVTSYGAKCDGSTDDTAAIQICYRRSIRWWNHYFSGSNLRSFPADHRLHSEFRRWKYHHSWNGSGCFGTQGESFGGGL